MSPLERLEWLTKVSRSGATFAMMAVAADIAYRAGDAGAFGLPDGGLKPAGARRARAALLNAGWLTRTKSAWFPSNGGQIATDTTNRYSGSATVVAPIATVVAPTATVVANIATVVAHNREDINGTINKVLDIEDPFNGQPPIESQHNANHLAACDAKFASPSLVSTLKGMLCCLGRNNSNIAEWQALIDKHGMKVVSDAVEKVRPDERWPNKVAAAIWDKDKCPYPPGTYENMDWHMLKGILPKC